MNKLKTSFVLAILALSLSGTAYAAGEVGASCPMIRTGPQPAPAAQPVVDPDEAAKAAAAAAAAAAAQ